jgi:hypothetical protein
MNEDTPRDPTPDPIRIERAFRSLERAIRSEGYDVFIDPDGVYSIKKKSDTGLYELDPSAGD